MATEKFNATIPTEIINSAKAIAQKEERSTSAMVSILLREAITARLESAKSLPN